MAKSDPGEVDPFKGIETRERSHFQRVLAAARERLTRSRGLKLSHPGETDIRDGQTVAPGEVDPFKGIETPGGVLDFDPADFVPGEVDPFKGIETQEFPRNLGSKT